MHWPPQIAHWWMGYFPLSKMYVQVVTSLKNEAGWRTPSPKPCCLHLLNVTSLLTSSAKIGDAGCINSQLSCIISFFFNQFEIISQLSPHYFNFFLVSFFHFICSQTFILIKIIAVNSESLIHRWVRFIYPSPACKPTTFDSFNHLGSQDDILERDTAIKKIQNNI